MNTVRSRVQVPGATFARAVEGSLYIDSPPSDHMMVERETKCCRLDRLELNESQTFEGVALIHIMRMG
jgi:hypothetical protein